MHCPGAPTAIPRTASRRSAVRPRPAGRAIRALLVATWLTLGLSGCSVIGVFYERLDTLVLREAERWFDLDSAQAVRLRERVDARLAQHRAEELPRYAAFLERSADVVGSSATPEQLQQKFDLLEGILRDALRHSIPALSDTLAELQPTQVERFARRLEESNAEYREEYLDAPATRRRAERIEAATEGVERWSGRLEPAQRALLADMIDAIPDDAGAWYERRLLWQQGLLELLRQGASAQTHAAYLESWWIDDSRRDAGHAAQLERNRAVTAAALATLIDGLSPAQRTRAAGRLRDMAAEFRVLHARAVGPGAAADVASTRLP